MAAVVNQKMCMSCRACVGESSQGSITTDDMRSPSQMPTNGPNASNGSIYFPRGGWAQRDEMFYNS
jgi:hypothetical protein